MVCISATSPQPPRRACPVGGASAPYGVFLSGFSLLLFYIMVLRKVKSGSVPPFERACEIVVANSYHNTSEDFNFVRPLVASADIVSPESAGLHQGNVDKFLRTFQGSIEDKSRAIAAQFELGRPEAEFNAALVGCLYNHPNLVLLDVFPSEEEAVKNMDGRVGSSVEMFNDFMLGEFDSALEFGFDTVESRARSMEERHNVMCENSRRVLPFIVNGAEPAHGDRVRCLVMMGRDHMGLTESLSHALTDSGDVLVSPPSVQEGVSLGFDRLVHKVMGAGDIPLDRGIEANQEQLARGILDMMVINFYPHDSPMRLDAANSSSVIADISDGFGLGDIRELCGKAGAKVRELSGKTSGEASAIWARHMMAAGASFPDTYPEGKK